VFELVARLGDRRRAGPTWCSAGFVYDGCAASSAREGRARGGGDQTVGILVFFYICIATWIACQLFAGRAAFLLTGAMIATIMSANVVLRDHSRPAQGGRALRAGQPVDPNHGKRGKQRSVHNTYFTLPVIIAMLSNHYGLLYQFKQNLGAADHADVLAGALIRAFFVNPPQRHAALGPGARGDRADRSAP
jgi:uncharacterized membrane protein